MDITFLGPGVGEHNACMWKQLQGKSVFMKITSRKICTQENNSVNSVGLIDDLRKSRGLHLVSANKHGLYIYRSRPAGVAQSRRTFVGGTVSTWARWWIPRNADQALTVRGEHADRIVGSPSWQSSINYNRSMPEDLKLSQISSSQQPPPFRGLHSPGVRKLSNYLCLLFPEIVYSM